MDPPAVAPPREIASEGGSPSPQALGGGDRHDPLPTEIVVSAGYRRDRADLLSSVSVLQGAELDTQLRPTIGETLARQPGVSATSFGPNASRPILRGLDAERVRVLTDGIGSFDVSNTSVDHAVIVNPQLAERIEVLRGPAAILYGSSAIGGVVNVIDSRIPRHAHDEAVHLDLLGQYGSAAREGSFGGVLDVPLGRGWIAHADGSYLETGDLGIGGFVLSPSARAQALASPNADVRALAALKDRLPNTASRTVNGAGAIAYVGDHVEGGVSVAQFSTLYGVPTRFDLDTGDGERTRIAAGQTRIDGRASYLFDDGFLDRINVRAGYARYQHQEIADDGTIGTTFRNNGGEGRLEFVQRERNGWRGTSGAQLFVRDFEALGDEAFVPRNETTQWGLFTLQELNLGRLRLEGGARYERTTVATQDALFRGLPNRFNRSFDAVSGTVGASVKAVGPFRIGLNLSRSERAPSAEELLANGPHGGTQAFEIGNRGFTTERSIGAELTLKGNASNWRFEGAAYIQKFDGFIYQQQTAAVDADSGLPVFQYAQAPARFWGLEGQLTVTLLRRGPSELNVDATADYVNATILNGIGPVPRIPPFRFLGGISYGDRKLNGRIEVETVDRQDRVAPVETVTPAYTLVNASIAWKPAALERLAAQFVLSLNNIGDVDARRATSFLKDFAPLPGRDVRLSLRMVY
ncbi:MAG: TonB-dependent receptor [Sphingomonadaceae bacterium]|nr:TonB-dependent receptor [Sphingomonadaceae bacterium]